MNDQYDVRLTDLAFEQLQEISRYIACRLQSPNTALRLLNTLENKISSLSRMPERITLTDEEPWRSYGVHAMPVKNFLIYFVIDEAAMRVQVTAIIYGRRDQARQLQEMDME